MITCPLFSQPQRCLLQKLELAFPLRYLKNLEGAWFKISPKFQDRAEFAICVRSHRIGMVHQRTHNRSLSVAHCSMNPQNNKITNFYEHIILHTDSDIQNVLTWITTDVSLRCSYDPDDSSRLHQKKEKKSLKIFWTTTGFMRGVECEKKHQRDIQSLLSRTVAYFQFILNC